jgi:pantothenate kinase
MRVGLHGLERSHAVSESRSPSLTKKASTAAFPADFIKTGYYAKQRSRFSETETRFAVFITKKQEDFMSIRNEIKAQIVRAGFTMQEVVDRLAEEYDWSDSVSNLSAKLQRESIRYKEVVELADVLDCDIVWVKRGARR